MILDRIGGVEGEWTEQTDEWDRPAQLCNLFSGLGCKQVPPEARFGPLRVLEFDNGGGLDGLLLDAEVSRCYLSDDILLDLVQLRRVPSFACRHE